VVAVTTVHPIRQQNETVGTKFMLINKDKKIFLLRRKGEKEPDKTAYKSIGHIRQRNNVESEYFLNTYEIIEYNMVEVGVIQAKDLDTRFPKKK
jgi:hypothetical protein